MNNCKDAMRFLGHVQLI